MSKRLQDFAVSRRAVLRGALVAGGVGAVNALGVGVPTAAAAGATKTRSTYYTEERVAAARQNVQRYAWAQALRDTAVTNAEAYAGLSNPAIWGLVTGQQLPRSYAVNQLLGSPITGQEIYQYGNYPWLAEPLGSPWKMTDPSSDYVFPTNDFGAFYTSGLDASGQFDPELADRSLLVNELYPDRGETWGVDDGYGWIDDNGDKWTFIAYYNHWHAWYSTAPIYAGLTALRDAYIYTGDVKYAHAGIILLDRVADVYPSMDTSVYKVEDGYLASDGLSGRGKVVGCIWETGLARVFVQAYDAFFPALATNDAANVVPFLSQQAQQHGLPPKDTVEGIRANVEDNILRVVYQACQDAQIYGNFGMHQGTLTMAAVVLDTAPETTEMIDFVFASGGRVGAPDYYVTGGNVSATLVDLVDRDGFGNEGAPGYNDLWVGNVGNVATALAGYDGYPAADLYQHPKYARMIRNRGRLTMLNAYLPPIGDTGSTGKPGVLGTAAAYVDAFERYDDVASAQLAYLLNGSQTDGLYSGIFATNVEGTQAAIARVIKDNGTLALPSEMLTGFGFAALRSGAGAKMRGAWISAGRTSGHGHADALNLGLHGYGVDLLPELGYPEFADNNARRIEWNANTIAHNTVVVDATRQQTEWDGKAQGFGVGARTRVMDIAAPSAYPQTSRYRRVTALIDIDESRSYAVDIFRVVGGNDHHFSFHAAEGPATATGLELVEQPTGSYAGPDVEPPPDDATPRPGASGFDWLGNVARDTAPPASFSVDWAVKDTWDVHDPDPDLHVRLHVVTQVDDVALCDGIPPRNKPGNPKSLRYLIAHRAGADLSSDFVSVIEPYVDEAVVTSVERVPVTGDADACAIRIVRADGVVDYVVSSVDTEVELEVDQRFRFRGSFGVLRLRDDRPIYAFGHDASAVGGQLRGLDAVTGTAVDFTRELVDDNALTVAVGQAAAVPVGAYVHVANDGERSAVYQIRSVRDLGGGQLRLGLGDVTLIRGYVDPADFSKGFRYDVAAGQAVRIPLTREWHR